MPRSKSGLVRRRTQIRQRQLRRLKTKESGIERTFAESRNSIGTSGVAAGFHTRLCRC